MKLKKIKSFTCKIYISLIVSALATTADAEYFYSIVQTKVYGKEEGQIFPFNVNTRGTLFSFNDAEACEKHLIKLLKDDGGWSLVPTVGNVGVKLERGGGIVTLHCVEVFLPFPWLEDKLSEQ